MLVTDLKKTEYGISLLGVIVDLMRWFVVDLVILLLFRYTYLYFMCLCFKTMLNYRI
jgi:hypothetical protein